MKGASKQGHTPEALLARAPVRWLALLLISVGITGAAAYSYRAIHKELTSIALLRRETVAQLAAVTLAEKFGRVVDVTVSLSTRVRFRELAGQGKWLEAIEIMRDVPHDLPHIERLFLADLDGTLKADTPALPGVRGKNFAAREWFQGVSDGWRPYVSPVYIRTAAPQLRVFAVAAPVRNPAGRVVAILVAQLRAESLLDWLAKIEIGPEAFIYVSDSKEQVAFHSKHRGREAAIDVSKTPVAQRLRRGEDGVAIEFDPVEGEESIIAYAATPKYGWSVVAQQPTRASPGLNARDEQLRRLLAGYLLILSLSVAAALFGWRIAIARERAREDRRVKAKLTRLVAERTRELEVANKELETFSYSVSHDLRAPLRAIDGFGQALLEDCAGRLDEQGRHYLQRIRNATQRMGQLIDDLLKLSRATRTEINREPVDLAWMAQVVIEELQKSEPAREVTVQLEEGMVAQGDFRLLRIVLENLLANAWKFTGRTEHARVEMFTISDDAGECAYCVRDNGVGFDMAYADKLFGAFQRLHGSGDFPGTGIGLATVQRIVHRHGGRVWAESQPGKGACFCFTFGPPSRPSTLEHSA